MKKTVVASLAAAMVMGIAGTSFAAANPFVDVPAKHWSYDSVTKLAQAGIVDGYADGKFQGDKVMTRYEMAQVVAKAMAKSDKADAKQKAAIDKLAAEYATELNTIGVRVTALEKNQANLKFNGTVDMRYTNKDFDKKGTASSATGELRFRLEATAKIDDNTTFGVRFVNNSPEQNAPQNASGFGLGTNKSWTKFGNDGGTTKNMTADRYFITTKMNDVTATIGRQKLVVGNTGTIVDSGVGTFDGINLKTKLGKVDTALSYGRLPGTAAVVAVNQKDIQVAEFGTTFGKLSGTIGYFGIKDNDANYDILKLYYANGKYQFNSKFSMNAELGQNKADYADNANKFGTVWATYGDQVLAKKGQSNVQVRYYAVGRNALATDNTFAYLGTISEGVEFGTGNSSVKSKQIYFNYAFSSNLTGQIGYYVGTGKNNSDRDYKMLRTIISAKF